MVSMINFGHKIQVKNSFFFWLFKFLRRSWAWDWEWSSNQSLYSAGDSGVINAPCLSTAQTLRSNEISQPLLTISKNEKIFCRSHISTLYALLRCFCEIYNEALLLWTSSNKKTISVISYASLLHTSVTWTHHFTYASLPQTKIVFIKP